MSIGESIRQAVKFRKDLFQEVWPDHPIPEEKEDQSDTDGE